MIYEIMYLLQLYIPGKYGQEPVLPIVAKYLTKVGITSQIITISTSVGRVPDHVSAPKIIYGDSHAFNSTDKTKHTKHRR